MKFYKITRLENDPHPLYVLDRRSASGSAKIVAEEHPAYRDDVRVEHVVVHVSAPSLAAILSGGRAQEVVTETWKLGQRGGLVPWRNGD